MNVTSLYCDVLPHTECEMKMYPVLLNTTTWQYVYYPVTKCVKTYKEVVHMKKKPVCVKKPKYHCSSKWKMLPSGEKVIELKYEFHNKSLRKGAPLTNEHFLARVVRGAFL